MLMEEREEKTKQIATFSLRRKQSSHIFTTEPSKWPCVLDPDAAVQQPQKPKSYGCSALLHDGANTAKYAANARTAHPNGANISLSWSQEACQKPIQDIWNIRNI